MSRDILLRLRLLAMDRTKLAMDTVARRLADIEASDAMIDGMSACGRQARVLAERSTGRAQTHPNRHFIEEISVEIAELLDDCRNGTAIVQRCSTARGRNGARPETEILYHFKADDGQPSPAMVAIHYRDEDRWPNPLTAKGGAA